MWQCSTFDNRLFLIPDPIVIGDRHPFFPMVFYGRFILQNPIAKTSSIRRLYLTINQRVQNSSSNQRKSSAVLFFPTVHVEHLYLIINQSMLATNYIILCLSSEYSSAVLFIPSCSCQMLYHKCYRVAWTIVYSLILCLYGGGVKSLLLCKN